MPELFDIPAVNEFIRESNLIEGVDDAGADRAALRAYLHLLEHERLNLNNILDTHLALLKDIDMRIAGKLRNCNVRVGNRMCPDWSLVPKLLDAWFMNHARANTEDTIKKAHIAFEKIHGFEDGNGRLGRIIINWQRTKARPQLSVLIIKASERQEYYRWFK